jgi:hypothetical protein
MKDELSELAHLIEQAQELLDEASSVQWEAPPVASSREEARIRSTGSPTDPTAAVALDERRLRIRHELQQTQNVLARYRVDVVAASRRLERALNAWRG